VRSDNSALQHTLNEVMAKNEELSSKINFNSARLDKISSEKIELESEVVMLREQQVTTLTTLEEKEQLVQDYSRHVSW